MLLSSGMAMAQTNATNPDSWKSSPSRSEKGTTSGPAAGGNVEPSAATHKTGSEKYQKSSESTSAGAPGVEAKKGSEGGARPSKGPPQR
jgi:hypothetical protein